MMLNRKYLLTTLSQILFFFGCSRPLKAHIPPSDVQNFNSVDYQFMGDIFLGIAYKGTSFRTVIPIHQFMSKVGASKKTDKPNKSKKLENKITAKTEPKKKTRINRLKNH